MKSNVSVISYLIWIGWIISFVMFTKKENKTEFNRFHMRQSLGIHVISVAVYLVCSVISYIPILGGMACSILYTVIAVMLLWGIIGAFGGKKNKIPFVGDTFQRIFRKVV